MNGTAGKVTQAPPLPFPPARVWFTWLMSLRNTEKYESVVKRGDVGSAARRPSSKQRNTAEKYNLTLRVHGELDPRRTRSGIREVRLVRGVEVLVLAIR